MEQFSPLQSLILKQLYDGQQQSLSELRNRLKITLKSLTESIEELIAFGFDLHIDRAGCQWRRPLPLLDKIVLEEALKLKTPYRLHLFAGIDSTNRYLKSLPADEYLHICSAEKQSQGRGRFGRYWHSPCAENIYCSSRWPLFRSDLSGLSLVVGLVIITVLQDLGIQDLQVKWPNDILWKGKKLAGILIEVIENQAIIGIGININADTLANPLPERLWCSLFEITGQYFDRNRIIAPLVMKLEACLQRFRQKGFEDFMAEWQTFDFLANKKIKISHPSGILEGFSRGVLPTGELILEDNEKNRHFISSGEASLKNNDYQGMLTMGDSP